jgi:CRP/FNR family transcriptional regulator, cyclic AMP receptor protein
MRWRRDAIPEVISGTPLFAGCSKQELREVAAVCREETLPDGHVLIREGERGGAFYVLLDGTVEVRQSGQKIGVLGPGEWVGEVALISQVPRTATIVTTSPLDVLVLTDDAFQKLLNDVPSIAEKVHASLRERQRPVDHVVVVTFRSPDGRQWSAIGGGTTAEEAIRFARDCCPAEDEWELVGSSSLHGD